MVEGDWCIVGAWNSDNSLQVHEHMGNRGGLYLKKFGYTEEQAYMLMACAPVESRVLTTANKPNMGISIGLPLDIFDFDISFPASGAPSQRVFSGPAELSEEKAAKIYPEQAEEVL